MNTMKAKTLVAFILVCIAVVPLLYADSGPLNGTWSGNWTPQTGVPDAITVELRQEGTGPVKGKFLNPAPMELSKATYNSKTRSVAFEATDQKTGKQYKLEGKVEGNEIKGTLVSPDTSGEVRLIKWTFFGR